MNGENPVELWSGSGSPFAWRVRLALELKGVPYVTHPVNLFRGEQYAPAQLALNPRGKVPVIRHGEFVLHESMAILAWLDRKFPEPPLFGSTPEEAGLIWRFISEMDEFLIPQAREVVGPIMRGGLDEHRSAVLAQMELVWQELDRLDRHLDGRRCLVGNRPSAADLCLFPLVATLQFACGLAHARALGLDELPSARALPGIQGWMARMAMLPGFARTVPQAADAATLAA